MCGFGAKVLTQCRKPLPGLAGNSGHYPGYVLGGWAKLAHGLGAKKRFKHRAGALDQTRLRWFQPRRARLPFYFGLAKGNDFFIGAKWTVATRRHCGHGTAVADYMLISSKGNDFFAWGKFSIRHCSIRHIS